MEQNTPIIFKRKKHKDILTNNIDLLHQKTIMNASLNSVPSSLTNKQGLSGLILMKSQDNKTKKKQKSLSTFDKSKLWDVFDKDIQTQYNTDDHKHNSELECVYNGQGSASEACKGLWSESQNDSTTKSGASEACKGLWCSEEKFGDHVQKKTEQNGIPNSSGDRRSPMKFVVGGVNAPLPVRELDLCTLCNSVLIIMEDGFPTCTNTKCGIIYKNTLDYSPEWRFYGADDKNTNDPTRCGNPINPLLVESSYGCKILCTTKSSYEMKKIRKWTEWQSMPHKEKSLYEEFQFITIMAQNAGIPKIFIDDAMIIHKDISEQKMFRGLNRDGIKAASIYISCRLNSCPRTAHEISEIFKLDKTSATNGCSTAVNILNNIERDIEPSQQTNLQQTTPSSFIERYCSKLNVNAELTMLSKFVAQKVEHAGSIMDNTPHAIAAGIIFFISQNCNLNISKYDIKQICGVSEVTINKCFKKLENMRATLIPNCILEKYK